MSSFIRKVKKLKRDPRQFFVDSKVYKKVSVDTENEKDPEPRVIGELDFNSAEFLKFKDKAVRHKAFSTLFLLPDELKTLSKAPLFGDMLKNEDDFIGFREKTLFALRVKSLFSDISDVYGNLVHQVSWHSGKLLEFKNIVLFGRYVKLAEFFRNANVNTRVYGVVGEKDQVDNELFSYVDHLFLHKKHQSGDIFHPDCTHFANTKKLLAAISQRITQAGEKPFDLLIPVYGNVDYMSDIDELNERSIDGLITLKSSENLYEASCFADYIDSMASDINVLLLRESWMQRYASFVSRGDFSSLLKAALNDGARIEVR